MNTEPPVTPDPEPQREHTPAEPQKHAEGRPRINCSGATLDWTARLLQSWRPVRLARVAGALGHRVDSASDPEAARDPPARVLPDGNYDRPRAARQVGFEMATHPADRSGRVGRAGGGVPRRVTGDAASIQQCAMADAACTAAAAPVPARRRAWSARSQGALDPWRAISGDHAAISTLPPHQAAAGRWAPRGGVGYQTLEPDQVQK
jgi:hypothetical protein